VYFKVTVSRDFQQSFFSSNNPPEGTDSGAKAVSHMASNLPRYPIRKLPNPTFSEDAHVFTFSIMFAYIFVLLLFYYMDPLKREWEQIIVFAKAFAISLKG
jgi:hypothetical protein